MADESIVHLEDPVDAAKNNIELILKENTKLKRIIVELRKELLSAREGCPNCAPDVLARQPSLNAGSIDGDDDEEEIIDEEQLERTDLEGTVLVDESDSDFSDNEQYESLIAEPLEPAAVEVLADESDLDSDFNDNEQFESLIDEQLEQTVEESSDESGLDPGEYEVDRIVRRRLLKNWIKGSGFKKNVYYEYEVAFVGYPPEDTSWRTYEELEITCKKKLTEFLGRGPNGRRN